MVNGLTSVTGLLSDRDSFVRKARTQAATQETSYDVYISATGSDIEKMQELAVSLSEDGILVFTNDLIRVGEGWADQVQASLQASSHFILMADEKLSKSQQIELETFLAEGVTRSTHSRVVLILTSNRLNPPSRGLSQYQQVDWTTGVRTAAQIEIALSLRWRGDVAQWMTTLVERESSLGSNHSAVLATRMNLAVAYGEAGQPSEAIALWERILADQIDALGPHNLATLDTQMRLADAFREAGRLDQAIALHERTLADRERVLGDTHPDTLASRDNLAEAYREAGRLDQAIALHERTLADRERVLGDDPPRHAGLPRQPCRGVPGGRTAGSSHRAARAHPRRPRAGARRHPPRHAGLPQQPRSAYQEVGRLDEAIRLYERTLPTASGCSATPTPTRWPPATTSLWLIRK